MQRDMAGNANAEVVNSSGTIETQNGDITINTAHLLNQRDGLSVTQTNKDLTSEYPWLNGALVKVPLDFFEKGELGYYTIRVTTQLAGDAGREVTHIYTYAAPLRKPKTWRYPFPVLRLAATVVQVVLLLAEISIFPRKRLITRQAIFLLTAMPT